MGCWGGEAHLREGHVVLIGGAQKGQAGVVADEGVKHAGGLAGQRREDLRALDRAGRALRPGGGPRRDVRIEPGVQRRQLVVRERIVDDDEAPFVELVEERLVGESSR